MTKVQGGKHESTLLHEIDALVETRLGPSNRDESTLLQKIDEKMREMDMMMELHKKDDRFEERMTNMDNVIENMNRKMSNIEEQPIVNYIDTDEINTGKQLEPKSEAMDKNIFSLMIVSQPNSPAWWYGLSIILFQIVIIALIIHEQFTNTSNKAMWNVPIQVASYVTFAQFIALILVMLSSSDFIFSVKSLWSMYERSVEEGTADGDKTEEETKVEEVNGEKVKGEKVKGEENPELPAADSISLSVSEYSSEQSSKEQYRIPNWVNTVIPPVLQLAESSLFLFASLVVILQSEKMIQLFVNLTALQVVSYCSKLGYRMSEENYFGNPITEASELVTQTQLDHHKPKRWKKVPIYTYIIMFVFAVMVVVWAYVSQAQHNRTFLKQNYNVCLETIGYDEFDKVADRTCDGMYNTPLCGYDGGDCVDFNKRWPGCTVFQIERINDGQCDANVKHSSYNTKECGYDGGDCLVDCAAENRDLLGNGDCDNYYPYNTAECSFDGGDCNNFNLKYKDCKCPKNDDTCSAESVLYLVEDGKCDNFPPYNSTSCKYDGGDCDFFYNYPNCFVDQKSWIGDGYCDNFEPYNTAECGYDSGECVSLNKRYPNCKAPYLEYIGDGYCDGPLWNTAECDYDGGDCLAFEYPQCEAFDYWELGNGRCWDKFPYNTAQCGYDGGDCEDLEDLYPDCDITKLPPYFKWFPTSIGDKLCELDFNTTECGWDGGDCLKKEKNKNKKE